MYVCTLITIQNINIDIYHLQLFLLTSHFDEMNVSVSPRRRSCCMQHTHPPRFHCVSRHDEGEGAG